MKILAKTTGAFTIYDPATGEAVRHGRPGVIRVTPFFTSRTTLGQLEKIADLPDEATDADFAGYWAECKDKPEMAIESFLSKFAEKPAVAPKKGAK
jgi:hypothetical protein